MKSYGYKTVNRVFNLIYPTGASPLRGGRVFKLPVTVTWDTYGPLLSPPIEKIQMAILNLWGSTYSIDTDIDHMVSLGLDTGDTHVTVTLTTHITLSFKGDKGEIDNCNIETVEYESSSIATWNDFETAFKTMIDSCNPDYINFESNTLPIAINVYLSVND